MAALSTTGYTAAKTYPVRDLVGKVLLVLLLYKIPLAFSIGQALKIVQSVGWEWKSQLHNS